MYVGWLFMNIKPRRKRRKSKAKRKIRLLLILSVSVYIFSYFFAFSHIDNLESSILNTAANSLFEKAVADSLADSQELISEITGDENGFYLEGENLIKLKAKLITDAQKGINKTETLYIPFGNFTGIAFLEGLLYPIPVRVNFMGNIKVTFKESFESCGVNQSIYYLKICIEGDLSPCSLKFQGEKFNLYTEYILSERLIMGQVPSYYLQNS